MNTVKFVNHCDGCQKMTKDDEPKQKCEFCGSDDIWVNMPEEFFHENQDTSIIEEFKPKDIIH